MSFKSWRSYWQFRHTVKNKSRYILDAESKDFLKAIEETCTSRIEKISMSDSLWRAQIGCNYVPEYQEDIHVDYIPVPFADERMKPLSNSASEGRSNPKGMPYLYVATDKETAMSEVRPSLGAILSVGKFKPTRELKIINCKKCTKPATNRVCIRPLKTLNIRTPMTEMIRPLLSSDRHLIFI